MTARWANPGDDTLDALELVQRSLSVGMVMTPRADLSTCRREETACEVMARNTERFSFLPVVNVDGCILGVYNAERWFAEDAPSEPIGHDFEPFSEDMVIGTDAAYSDRYIRVEREAREATRGMWGHAHNFDPRAHRHRELRKD